MTEPVLERIRWVDSHSAGGVWLDVQTLREEMQITVIETIGWVMHDEDDRLIVACSRSENGDQVGEVICIVKAAVMERHRIP